MSVRRLVALLALLAAALAAAAPALAASRAPAAAAPAPAPSTSPTVSPTPTPAPTSTVIPVTPRVELSAPRSLWLGGQATLRVRVTPSLPGAAVTIESGADGVWTPVAAGVLDATSGVALSWRPSAFGRVWLRAVVAAGEANAAAVSSTHRVTVNRPNRHHVPWRFAHYIVIVVHEYRLYYYEHGELVRRFTVALGRPGFRTPLGTFHIYGKRRPGGGALGSCVMFYRRKGGIAIHGTSEPWLLRRFPRPFSHGCARMYDSQALWLYARVPKGTTVRNLR